MFYLFFQPPSLNTSDTSIIDNEDENLDDEVESLIQMKDTPEPSEASTSSVTPKTSKARGSSGKRQHEEDKLIQSLTQSISSKLSKKSEGSKQNPTTTFANYIASQLSELDAKTRAVAQHKINEILFQAQMGTLMENEARRFPPQQYMTHQYETRPWNLQSPSQSMGLPQGYQHQENDWAPPKSQQPDGVAQPRMHLMSLTQGDFSNDANDYSTRLTSL